MRIAILGGTRFIGRAIVEELTALGHSLLLIHRGQLEPPGLPAAQHVHSDRNDLTRHRTELDAFAPEAMIEAP